MREPLERVVAATAAHGLPSAPPLPSRPLDDSDFEGVLRATRRQRVLGILATAVADGAFPVTDDQRARCAAAEQDWAVQAVRVERLLLDAAPVLERAGVPYRVFKGPALAHTVYPHPGWRMFADLDLLVPGGERFDAARDALLGELDGTQPIPELVPGFDAEFGKDAPLAFGRLEIDLHRTFASGPVGFTIPLDALFGADAAPTIALGGRALPTLTPPVAFLQACINAALGDLPVRTCSLRDVVQLAAFVEDDVESILAIAREWRIGMVVQRAVQLAWPVLGLAPGPFSGWAASYRAPATERWTLRAYLNRARSYSRPAASLLVIRGVGARLRYARALLLPQRAYLASRGWARSSPARYAVEALRRPGARHG